jgi:hypothetical protein
MSSNPRRIGFEKSVSEEGDNFLERWESGSDQKREEGIVGLASLP